MNQVYKVVLCATTGIYKAVPEFARSKSKSSKATVGAVAIMTAITLSGGAQAATEGIQTGVNDVAIGEQATSTGQNNIAIGQGSFAAGGTLTEAEANQLIANSTAKINQISNTQKTIAQKEAAIAEYLATVEKVERNQAEIERLTVLNEQEKSKTSGLTTSFETANSIYLQKQAEVDTKVGFLEQLDLNDYGPLNESGLSQIANDVKLYIEGENTPNSLGDEFYQDYVSAYIEKLAKLDYTRSLSEAAASPNGFYNEDTQKLISASELLGDAARYYGAQISDSSIPVTTIETFEKRLQKLVEDEDYFNANKDVILDSIINTNSQVKAMYGENKEVLGGYLDMYYTYKSNEIKLVILQKQTGVMDGSEPDYLAKINEVKALKKENDTMKDLRETLYTSANIGSYLNSRSDIGSWLETIASLDSRAFSADVIGKIQNAESIQANTLKTYLTDQIAAVKKDSDDASKALSDNQKVIAAYELNIKNRQPTAEELQAYNKAKAEEAILIQQKENLANQTAELQALQDELKDGKDALALGANAKAIGDGAVALGANNDVIASEAVALGTGNNVTGDNSVAIGTGNTVSGAQSIAVGTGHTVTGNNSGAFGDPNLVSGNESYAYGNNNTISSDNSHVIGNSNNTAAMSSLIFGNGVSLTAQAANSIVIGSGATSSVNGGVAIGNNSVADRVNTISVGSAGSERQIVNVATGVNSTDAVNVKQLSDSLGAKADVSYVDDSNALQNTVIDEKANQADLNQTNSNVNANTTAISENSGAIANNTTAITENSSAIASNTTSITENTTAISENSGAIANNTTAITENTTAISENSSAIASNNTAINTKVDEFVTAQGNKDDNQDAVIAGKVGISEFEADQARQDAISNSKANQSELDATNQMVADNKTDQAAIDANQDTVVAGKADTSYVDNENASQNAVIGNLQAQTSQNTADISNKADISYVDAQNDAQNLAIDKNSADILTKADVTYVDSENDAQNAAINQNTIDISNKADLGYVDAQNEAQDDVINAVQNQTNQNAIDISNKADVGYVDAQNADQNVIIASKTDQSDFVAEQARQNTINESQNITISSKTDQSDFVAEQARQNTINESQNIAISSKVNKDEFAAEQARQNTVNESQNAAISGKVDKDVFMADQARQDAENEAQNVEIAAKADISYVDEKNNAQDVVTSKNTSDIAVNTIDIADLKAADTTMVEAIENTQVTINSRVDEMIKSQTVVDADQNRMIAENANRFAGLDQRIGSLDKTLSSGVASALAIGSMPTMSIAGAHMITGGSGYFNGQGSVAVGLTGTTDSGKVSYKIGGSYTQDGGSAFSIGSGYRWK